jgi:hypothetical protein
MSGCLCFSRLFFSWPSPYPAAHFAAILKKPTTMTPTDLPLGYYRHFKGAVYRVAGVARGCDSLVWHVYYQCCYGDWSYWLRPYDNFCEPVEREGVAQPRFVFLGADAPAELEGDTGAGRGA